MKYTLMRFSFPPGPLAWPAAIMLVTMGTLFGMNCYHENSPCMEVKFAC